MKGKVLIGLSLAAVLALIPLAALASNPFSDLNNTVDHYSTWDSDMINIEAVSGAT